MALRYETKMTWESAKFDQTIREKGHYQWKFGDRNLDLDWNQMINLFDNHPMEKIGGNVDKMNYNLLQFVGFLHGVPLFFSWFSHSFLLFFHGFFKELDFKELEIHRYSLLDTINEYQWISINEYQWISINEFIDGPSMNMVPFLWALLSLGSIGPPLSPKGPGPPKGTDPPLRSKSSEFPSNSRI